MRLVIGKQIRESAALRQSFFRWHRAPLKLTFPLARQGLLGERYLPYALAEEDRIVSNISVNVLDVLYDGAPRRYVQLGTVMSDPAFRGRGLSRRLMEKVLADWRGNCDMIYLYANDTVLDFYPKFGFERFIEHSQMYSLRPAPGDFVPLDLSRKKTSLCFPGSMPKTIPFPASPCRIISGSSCSTAARFLQTMFSTPKSGTPSASLCRRERLYLAWISSARRGRICAKF